MNLDKLKLKEIKHINFNINNLDYISSTIDDFIIQEAKLVKFIMERDRLAVVVSDGVNEAKFYIQPIDIKGQNILKDLLLTDKIENIPLESFPNLELGYFKK